MMKMSKLFQGAFAVALLLLTGAATAHAQISRVDSGRQAIGLNLGYFAVRGLDSRVEDDVLFQDLSQGDYSLAFDVKDFNGATIGGEYLVGVSDYLELGLGVGFYQKTVRASTSKKVRDASASSSRI